MIKDNKSHEALLCIIVLTYNHDKYIAQALESVLSQKTNFDFVVKIFDDCSTDNTAKIAKKYADLDDRVELVINKKNLGAKGNIIKALATVNSKYFAILEGDDYWCDDDKLQMQIDLMESEESIALCGHNTNLMKNEKIEGTILPEDFGYGKNIFNVVDVIEGRFYAHPSSIIYRSPSKELMTSLVKKKNSYARLGDFFNLMFFAQNGNIAYINKIMSVYRTDSGGIWSTLDNIKKQEDNIYMTVIYKKLLDKKYSQNFDTGAFYTVKSFIQFLQDKNYNYFKIMKYRFLLISFNNSDTELSFFRRYFANFLKIISLSAYRFMSFIGI